MLSPRRAASPHDTSSTHTWPLGAAQRRVAVRFLWSGSSGPVPLVRFLWSSGPVPLVRFLWSGSSGPLVRFLWSSGPVPLVRFLWSGSSGPVPLVRFLPTGFWTRRVLNIGLYVV
ncbi:hypothetical protein EYF80_055166 [Liparis tanakae]|uniref:Uncharacterized protein n=1 Tax=Liparis tanakae TaxID=230148 RepID=A0A4Z2F139_9TELE|nr:hypothetical protein EYF80_055166 [Liparis tanakae]